MLNRLSISLILLFLAVCLVAGPVLADTNPVTIQENPDDTRTVYSSLSLLLYYSGALDLILSKDSPSTATALDKMPFANIPDPLTQPTGDFASSGIGLSQSISSLFAIWQNENDLVLQFRLADAAKLNQQITSGLPAAQAQLDQLKTAAENTGSYLNITTLAPNNALVRTYNDVMDKINRLQAMLDLLGKPLLNQLLNNPDNPDILKQILSPTELSLTIYPQTAFVGDEVSLNVVLTSGGIPLAAESVQILLDSSQYVTVMTDSQGRYQGVLQVPYWYQPQLEVQAIYYPQGKDIGLYLGSSSHVVRMNVQYYAANLVLQVKGAAYPGREVTVTGTFGYGQSPPEAREKTGFYLDDAAVSQFTAQPVFTRIFQLDSAISTGKHLLTVSVPADGRYAPVNAACELNVVLAALVLDINTPKIAFIPFSLGINAQIRSDTGPLNNAAVMLDINGTRTQASTSADGLFRTRIKTGMGFNLLGSQTLTVQVQPQEPWNAPATATRSIFMINVVNCGILLIVLAVLAVYLPRRLRRWYGTGSKKRMTLPESPIPLTAPVYREIHISPDSGKTGSDDNGIFGWYRLALKLVHSLTSIALKPQQTLREYARENRHKLGPLSERFYEFTLMVERLLYSNHQSSREEIEKGRQLANSLKSGAKDENL